MKLNDTVLGALLVVFGLWVGLTATGFPDMPGQIVGPGTFPKAIGSLIAIGGAAIVLSGERRRALVELSEGWRDRKAAIAVLIALLGALALAFGFEHVGFPLGGSLLLCALFAATGRGRLPWFLLAIGFAFGVHILMTRLLHVPLPAGLLKGLL